MLVACFVVPQIGIACERTRLSALWGEPFALATSTSILQVVSDEAKASGIQAGQSASTARSLCERLIVLPYDREAYEGAAHSLWDLFAIESSVVEPISPEMCFVELSGKDALQRARQLAIHIATRVRVPIQVGLAKSKLVAQQAALQSGDAGVVVIEPGSEADFLFSVRLDRIATLDTRLCQRLQRLGVQTLGDVIRLPPRELQRQFKQSSYLLRRLAQGEDGNRVRALWPPRQLERSVRFDEEVYYAAIVHNALGLCAKGIARALVRQREYCRSLVLTVAFADGTQVQEGERLFRPLDSAEAITQVGLRLLKRVPVSQPVTSVKMSAGELGGGSGIQLTLLDTNDQGQGLPHERREQLDEALTYVRRRYGVGAVVTAALLRQARRIHLWTFALTRLTNEPVQVATDTRGTPVRFYRRDQTYEVRSIQNRWKETDWSWDKVVVKTAYRIETQPSGLYELYQIGVQWRLGAVAD